jgi:hypothetical protein
MAWLDPATDISGLNDLNGFNDFNGFNVLRATITHPADQLREEQP